MLNFFQIQINHSNHEINQKIILHIFHCFRILFLNQKRIQFKNVFQQLSTFIFYNYFDALTHDIKLKNSTSQYKQAS